MLLSLNLNEDLIDEESIPVSLVPPSKSFGVFGSKLDAPQSNRFAADRDSAFGHKIFDITNTQIEAVIKPDCVLNDLRRETVAFIYRCRLIHSAIVVQTHLTCQYLHDIIFTVELAFSAILNLQALQKIAQELVLALTVVLVAGSAKKR